MHRPGEIAHNVLIKEMAQYVLRNSCDTSVIYGMIRYTQKLKNTDTEQLNVDELIQ